MILPIDRCIVLPLRPASPEVFSGIGLALHFLLGNVLVLHTGLEEMWFGWRVAKIFPRRQDLENYCRDAAVRLDLSRTAREQKVRFWIAGTYTDRSAALACFDAESAADGSPIELPLSCDDGLVAFRARFIDGLASAGLAMDAGQARAALWPETIDPAGLDVVGRALERFYIASKFTNDRPLDPGPFKQAIATAPDSFMAHDIYGWALYQNRNYAAARPAFLKSLGINPSGAGAMSGLMWCGVYMQAVDEAMFWAGRKAEVCGRDVAAAREKGRQRYEKVNR